MAHDSLSRILAIALPKGALLRQTRPTRRSGKATCWGLSTDVVGALVYQADFAALGPMWTNGDFDGGGFLRTPKLRGHSRAESSAIRTFSFRSH